jgi:hypothetical protein
MMDYHEKDGAMTKRNEIFDAPPDGFPMEPAHPVVPDPSSDAGSATSSSALSLARGAALLDPAPSNLGAATSRPLLNPRGIPLTAILSPDAYSSDALVFPEATQRPGVVLDYFFMRRRSAAIGEQFWNVVAGGWADFNLIERTRCVRLFSRYQSYWTPDILSPEDRAFYDSLADEFTAYRGQNGVELATGGSFTLSEAVAHRYALGRRNVRYVDPTILSLRVAKKDVALALTARDEEEIVLFPAVWSNVRLKARHPARVTH